MARGLTWRAGGALVVAALGLAACGSDNSSSSSSSAATSAGGAPTTAAGGSGSATTATGGGGGGGKALKVVLLIGGPSNDGGFYQAMVDGLKSAAQKDGAMTVDVRDKLSSNGDAGEEDAVRQAASSKQYDLIVAHGFDLVPYVAKYAPQYPDQKFATSLPVDGEPANAEVYLSVFEEIGYNAGFLAAQGTKAKKVGFIGGPGQPFEKQAEAGFKEAVNKYAPGSQVSVVYTGTF